MSDKSRRKLLKSIAAGSGAIVAGKSLPESWSKPVVDSVMLPAHAQTSGTFTYFQIDAQQVRVGLLEDKQNMLADVVDTLVPNANAGGGGGGNNNNTDWCVVVTNGTANLTVVNNNNDAMWSGDAPTDGTPFDLPLDQDNCDLPFTRSLGAGGMRAVDYTLGDPTITFRTTEPEGPRNPWQVTIPISTRGCGPIGMLGECNSDIED